MFSQLIPSCQFITSLVILKQTSPTNVWTFLFILTLPQIMFGQILLQGDADNVLLPSCKPEHRATDSWFIINYFSQSNISLPDGVLAVIRIIRKTLSVSKLLIYNFISQQVNWRTPTNQSVVRSGKSGSGLSISNFWFIKRRTVANTCRLIYAI